MDMNRYLVVGRGLIGKELARNNQFELISHTNFYDLPDERVYNGYVCTAALSSERSCQSVSWDEVVRANVTLPLDLVQRARYNRASVVLFSTSGVYRRPGVAQEIDDVETYNRYTASKLMMEHAVLSTKYTKCYMFRIPFVCLYTDYHLDMLGRVRQWTKCEDVDTSIVYHQELMESVLCALKGDALGGIYNIMSGKHTATGVC